MKFLFASDSFKGTLSSDQTIELLNKAVREVFGECETDGVPVADGGEGTTEAVVKARHGEIVNVDVHGPLMETEHAFYGKLSDKEAILEMAAASGLPMVPEDKRNPLNTTTYGTGELLKAALDEGYTDIAIAIGGSATNDGGMGFARALGIRFIDEDGKELEGKGSDLVKVRHIDVTGLDPAVKNAHFTVMCDVTNPLCGPDGATYTFGKQKGGTPEILDELESGMKNYRDVIIKEFGINPDEIQGTGAAGGLGAALKVFLKAEMKSGIDTVLDLIDFDGRLKGVDLVVTGEGRTDWQSCFGKVMQGIGDRSKNHQVPVAALCGSLGPDYEKIYEHGISSIMTTVDGPMPLKDALDNAEDLYYKGAVRMFRFIKAGMTLSAG
ncbi:glycerate kinase family protein [Oribacterium sp. WCC10]|uniref:glycerate kinase family protein n=1 Tax=Oribacterium sp. WCC10 TaxID=1855343 RepID=UPI0008EB338D|nr:glycerate kinase [Oribacterium sp. WCC10]SFG77264.1 glycerate kinase [Oribacterium sp. WCC10]